VTNPGKISCKYTIDEAGDDGQKESSGRYYTLRIVAFRKANPQGKTSGIRPLQ